MVSPTAVLNLKKAIKLHAKADQFIVTETTKSRYLSVLEHRIRMLLGNQDPDPDPLVRGANPDPATAPSLF